MTIEFITPILETDLELVNDWALESAQMQNSIELYLGLETAYFNLTTDGLCQRHLRDCIALLGHSPLEEGDHVEFYPEEPVPYEQDEIALENALKTIKEAMLRLWEFIKGFAARAYELFVKLINGLTKLTTFFTEINKQNMSLEKSYDGETPYSRLMKLVKIAEDNGFKKIDLPSLKVMNGFLARHNHVIDGLVAHSNERLNPEVLINNIKILSDMLTLVFEDLDRLSTSVNNIIGDYNPSSVKIELNTLSNERAKDTIRADHWGITDGDWLAYALGQGYVICNAAIETKAQSLISSGKLASKCDIQAENATPWETVVITDGEDNIDTGFTKVTTPMPPELEKNTFGFPSWSTMSSQRELDRTLKEISRNNERYSRLRRRFSDVSNGVKRVENMRDKLRNAGLNTNAVVHNTPPTTLLFDMPERLASGSRVVHLLSAINKISTEVDRNRNTMLMVVQYLNDNNAMQVALTNDLRRVEAMLNNR